MSIFLWKKNNSANGLYYGFNNIYKFTKLCKLYMFQELDYKITKNIKNLTELKIFYCAKKINNLELMHILTIPKLEVLVISLTNYIDEFKTSNNTSLLELVLNNTKCTNNMIMDISSISTLKEIEFDNCDFDFKNLLILNNLKKLYSLNLDCKNLTDSNLLLISNINNITHLHIYSESNNITIDGLYELHKLKNLTYLILYIEFGIIEDTNNFRGQFMEKIGHPVQIMII